MINLSSKYLTKCEIDLLSKSLKFTPTPHNNTQELAKDIKEYTRKLRLAEFFCEEDEEEIMDENLAKNKSKFNPQRGRNHLLDTVCDTLLKIPLSDDNSNSTKHNLSKNEISALKSLPMDENIVIKEADKGGAVVIMDSDFYKSKILDMLNNDEFYSEINENQDKKTLQKIRKLTQKYPSALTKKEEDFITNFDSKESSFYGLPKVHKSEDIKNAIQLQNCEYITCIRPDDLKFRPIVGGPSAPTQRLSNLLDIILKPLCSEVRSFVRDDLEFLQHLPNKVNDNAILVTFDVVNLYTNISCPLGLRALEYWIDKHPEKIDERFTKEFLLEATALVLQNNVFKFNNKHYLQNKGTAMGTKMAPTYATLTLGFLEEVMYQKVKESFDEEFGVYIMQNWKRYLDDCFIIWNRDLTDLEKFQNILNQLDASLKFTMDHSTSCIPFLDVSVIKREDKIITDIFYKRTDTHQYLHFSSSHPRHTKRAIPYNLARRICTIVSEETTREQRLQELKNYLQKQNYPTKLIEDGIKKARELNRENLINKPTTNCITSPRILPFVTTHNPRNSNVTPIVRQLNDLLKTDEKMGKVMEKYTFINSKRQSKNLKRLLCKSDFQDKSQSKIFSVTKCADRRCGTCPFLREGNSFQFNNKIFTVNSDMSCSTKNLIYVITCAGCEKHYIGETGTTLRTRIRIHKQHISTPEYRKIKVSEHLDVCGHGQFSVFPFYKLYTEDTISRREKERHFIKTLKPALNSLL